MNNHFFLSCRTEPGFCPVWRAVALFVCLVVLWAVPALAETPTKKLIMPDTMAMTFDGLFKSAKDKTTPGNGYLTELLSFCAANSENGLLPERKDKGAGVYMVATLPYSLKEAATYVLNPDIPSAALYPNSVRTASWQEGGDLKQNWTSLTGTVSKDTPLAAHGMEYEQTTPDENSGCYYGYSLYRTFVMTTDAQGRRTLVTLAVQAEPSSVGRKGAVLGTDSDWNYLYTGKPGSTLPMVGWAETNIYDSATISVWTDTGTGIQLSVMKWLKAGWSGMNVVKSEHISRGVERYLDGLRQIMNSPRRPSPSAIIDHHNKLLTMNDDQLAQELNAWATRTIAAAKAQSLDSGDFAEACKNGYVPTLSREERIAELMKLFMKQQLGLKDSTS